MAEIETAHNGAKGRVSGDVSEEFAEDEGMGDSDVLVEGGERGSVESVRGEEEGDEGRVSGVRG